MNFQFVKGAVELASDLETKYVVVGSGRKDFYGRESRYWEWLIAALRELMTIAAPLGVTLAFEAAGLPRVLVHNLSRMQELLSYDGLEELGVLFDPSHYHIRGAGEVGAYRALSERVAHVHIKDARGDVEDFEFPPLGMGDIDFDALLGAIVAVDCAGYTSVEYEAFAWGYETDPRQVLTESKAFLDSRISSM